ncbi:mediator of RNA polymerase II transcription subunit 6 [Patella vulgata]|uniref:mediator of RNA polymerase II transcription subunit 6 n=1 Tax=Patella vulgata TaxID=6465 RepID=UPI00217FDD54|nr:mediator of RNA polymerase II transcription subunit 6 [Patella vulgata]
MNDRDHLSISWHDTAWIPVLNQNNVLDYFSERSNPFYDRMCNNEIIKMQRLNTDQLQNMVGIEYVLLHVQEPILYVIRKQHRHSPTQASPLAHYYIIAGIVYQAPDLCSVVNSRLLNCVSSLQSAFDEASGYSKYSPSKGYFWQFKEKEEKEKLEHKEKKKKKEEPSSTFQRHRVDLLLGELGKKFPPPTMAPPPETVIKSEEGNKPEMKTEIKTERPDDKNPSSMKPPPEKKPKMMR